MTAERSICMLKIKTTDNFFHFVSVLLRFCHRWFNGITLVIKRRGWSRRWLLSGVIARRKIGHGGWYSSTNRTWDTTLNFSRISVSQILKLYNTWYTYQPGHADGVCFFVPQGHQDPPFDDACHYMHYNVCFDVLEVGSMHG